MYTDRLQAALTRQSLEAESAAATHLEQRAAELIAGAARDGRWVLPNPLDQEGRHYEQGALIGYVLSGALDTVRVVVRQEEADRVRQDARRIEVKLVDRPFSTYRGALAREVPGGSDRLPAQALALDGGGPFATDPRSGDGLKTLVRTFQFDVALRDAPADLRFGTRALVRIEHAPRPMASQAWRMARQTLLSRLGV
jgi:putative peptide zinc metalloprotease protein